jgi:hypothetical protein
MSEAQGDQTPEQTAEEKPGAGVDRTVIRNLLALTPAERVRLLIESARNAAEIRDKMRFGR